MEATTALGEGSGDARRNWVSRKAHHDRACFGASQLAFLQIGQIFGGFGASGLRGNHVWPHLLHSYCVTLTFFDGIRKT